MNAHLFVSDIIFDLANAGRDVGIEKLAESIKRHGLLQRPVVRELEDGGFLLLAGERRVRAWKQLYGDATAIEVEVVSADDPRSSAEIRIAENGQREALTAVQLLGQVVDLVDAGESIEGIAIALGRSIGQVKKLCAVAELPDDVRKLIQEGRLSVPQGELLAQIHADPKRQRQLAKQWAGDDRGWWTLERCRDVIEEDDWHPLDEVMWDLGQSDIAEGAEVSCMACPSNTRAEPDLFDTVEDTGTRCANAACFKIKLGASLALARAAGQKFVEAKKDPYNRRSHALHGYKAVDLPSSAVSYEGNATKLSTLIAKAKHPPKTVMVVDRWRGRLVECLTEEAARELVVPSRSGKKAGAESVPLTPAELRKRAQNKARRDRVLGLAQQIELQGVDTTRLDALLGWFTRRELQRLGVSYSAKLARVFLPLASKIHDPKKQLIQWTFDHPEAKSVMRLYILTELVRETRGFDWDTNETSEIAKLFGLDLKKMQPRSEEGLAITTPKPAKKPRRRKS